MRGSVKLIFVMMCLWAAVGPAAAQKKAIPGYLEPAKALNAVNMVMVHDVVSPPVAGRYYAYIMQGAYVIVSANNKAVPPLQNIVKGFKPVLLDTIQDKYNYQIAAYYSILETARLLLPSGEQLADEEQSFREVLQKQKISPAIITRSVQVAQVVSAAIVAFSKSDHYNILSALKRYTPLQDEGKWYPTPPAYIEAVEPNWKTIRPMMLDSATEFKPGALIPFSKDTNSAFHKQVKAVYNVSRHLTPEQVQIAQFWDCNPFAVSTAGHMSIGYKKISPGGHWMNVAALVSKQQKLSFDQTITVLGIEGTTLMDAFISCWEEKYKSNRIRPETYINRYMDIKWQPVLQTPPFPEYTSGHAVISNASAEVLTYLMGDNIAYTDDTEIPFGSGERRFKSFNQAASEASISRFYGGIHYMESIDNGNEQGRRIGAFIVSKLKGAGARL